MKPFFVIAPIVLAAAFAAVPLAQALRADEPAPETLAPPEAPAEPAPEGDMAEGLGLLERGAQMVLRGFLDEIEPKMDEIQRGLGDAAKDLGPALDKLLTLFDDFRNYEAPERLPNGDIIIRRRPDAPPPVPLPDGDGVTEL